MSNIFTDFVRLYACEAYEITPAEADWIVEQLLGDRGSYWVPVTVQLAQWPYRTCQYGFDEVCVTAMTGAEPELPTVAHAPWSRSGDRAWSLSAAGVYACANSRTDMTRAGPSQRAGRSAWRVPSPVDRPVGWLTPTTPTYHDGHLELVQPSSYASSSRSTTCGRRAIRRSRPWTSAGVVGWFTGSGTSTTSWKTAPRGSTAAPTGGTGVSADALVSGE